MTWRIKIADEDTLPLIQQFLLRYNYTTATHSVSPTLAWIQWLWQRGVILLLVKKNEGRSQLIGCIGLLPIECLDETRVQPCLFAVRSSHRGSGWGSLLISAASQMTTSVWQGILTPLSLHRLFLSPICPRWAASLDLAGVSAPTPTGITLRTARSGDAECILQALRAQWRVREDRSVEDMPRLDHQYYCHY